jgi:predicted permease
MDAFLKDLRQAARALRRAPGFALTAVLTLALGIGASTAIFSVANAVLLRPLPYPQADRLVTVWGELRARNRLNFPFSPGDFQDLKEQATGFQDLAAVNPFRAPLTGEGEPEQVKVAGVTTNLLPLLGARMLHGRDFVAEDAQPQPQPPQGNQPPNAQQGPPPPPRVPAIVVLNHGFWQRRFGGDPGAVGKTLQIGGQSALVVGVLAPGFELLWPTHSNVDRDPDMFLAMRIDFANANRNNVFLRVVGRLKPGVPLATAQDQAERLAADLRQRFPIKKTADVHFDVRPMHEDLVRAMRPAIVALLGAVAFLLLIACANVANLLLVRAGQRERELAVRAALGGSPWRLVRQLLAESLVLALGGAVIGIALAWAGIKVLLALAPATLPRMDDVSLDPLVLAFAVIAALVSAVVFGLVPALRSARPDLAEVLRQAGRQPGLQGGRVLRSAVVTAEVALSFVLLIGGGLMARSFIALQGTDPGFDPNNVLTFVANPQSPEAGARAAYMRQLRERLLALPGVTAATAANQLPLDGGQQDGRWGTMEAAADPSKFQQAYAFVVLPGYFEAMRTPLLAGRTFTEEDNRPDALRLVVDERLARKAFPGRPFRDVVGERILLRVRSAEPETWEIIGVVKQQRHETLAKEGREEVFMADGIFGHGFAGRWAVRTTRDPAAMAPAVRRALQGLDPSVPFAEVQPMSAFVDQAMAPTRFTLALIGVFAGIATLLAGVGLYGVLSTVVRQRTAEIGVRMAFGAPSASIFRLVLGEGMVMSALGVVLGVLGALALTRVMRSLLVGVAPSDPATFAATAALFLAVAAFACWLPARRATRIDPVTAFRES